MEKQVRSFTVVGPKAGEDQVINGHFFEKGQFSIEVNDQQYKGLTNLFSYYSVLPTDEAELAAALDGDAADTGPKAPEVPLTGGSATANDPQTDGTPKPTLAEALGALDPENDAHWTSNHLPAIDHLETVTGTKVSRADVNTLAEDFTRAKARAVKAMA